MFGPMFKKAITPVFTRTSQQGQICLRVQRAYSVKSKAKNLNKLIDRIGDEKTQESQKTIKAIRMVGAGSVVLVLCSLFWASSLSAPVKETPVEIGNLSVDVRDR